MKNFLILLAGGIGSRMGTNMPKQFLIVNDKPVIVHTIECFQKNNNIDGIVIVCGKQWITYMQSLIDEFNLYKVKWIIEGGDTGHDSTRNGVFFLKDKINKINKIILIYIFVVII
jgi:2-C-methyl-D-erythritol 4-phosphate cytidylyltransferase